MKTKYISSEACKKHWNSIKEKDTHSWIDVSYHGSPWYKCEYCGVDKDDVYGAGPDPRREVSASPTCSKRKEVLKIREIERVRLEKLEYEKLLKERQRFEYLHAKYGVKG